MSARAERERRARSGAEEIEGIQWCSRANRNCVSRRNPPRASLEPYLARSNEAGSAILRYTNKKYNHADSPVIRAALCKDYGNVNCEENGVVGHLVGDS